MRSHKEERRMLEVCDGGRRYSFCARVAPREVTQSMVGSQVSRSLRISEEDVGKVLLFGRRGGTDGSDRHVIVDSIRTVDSRPKSRSLRLVN